MIYCISILGVFKGGGGYPEKSGMCSMYTSNQKISRIVHCTVVLSVSGIFIIKCMVPFYNCLSLRAINHSRHKSYPCLISSWLPGKLFRGLYLEVYRLSIALLLDFLFLTTSVPDFNPPLIQRQSMFNQLWTLT